MNNMHSAIPEEKLTEAYRLLLEMRDNCVKHADDQYDDPMREAKYEALNIAMDAMGRSIPPRWIPVEERMPEKHLQECLCRYVFDDIPGTSGHIHVLTWHAYGTNGYVYRPHFTDEGFESMRVTHWMPLPEPPEEVHHE